MTNLKNNINKLDNFYKNELQRIYSDNNLQQIRSKIEGITNHINFLKILTLMKKTNITLWKIVIIL